MIKGGGKGGAMISLLLQSLGKAEDECWCTESVEDSEHSVHSSTSSDNESYSEKK